MRIADNDNDRTGAFGDRPERQLWCAVIGRALSDAFDAVAAVSDGNERVRLRDEARIWFMRNGRDFRAACDSAGYDPDYLRSRFIRLMAERASAPGANAAPV